MTETVRNDLAPPPVGHNQPPETTEAASLLQERYKEMRATASSWLELKVLEDEETATKCDAFRKQLKLLEKDVEAERRRQKVPHELAAEEVDKKFRPILQGLKNQHADMGDMVTAWLKKKEQLLREAQAAAAEEAERAKRAAEAAADEALASSNTYAAQDEVAAATEAAEEAQAVADKLAGAKARVGAEVVAGGRKHATTLRSFVKVTGVSDRKKALAHFLKLKGLDWSKVDEAIMGLARQHLRAASAGGFDQPDMPGIVTTTEEKAI